MTRGCGPVHHGLIHQVLVGGPGGPRISEESRRLHRLPHGLEDQAHQEALELPGGLVRFGCLVGQGLGTLGLGHGIEGGKPQGDHRTLSSA